MACNHKFRNELYLKNLGYEPETLIVGTFNPEWPKENYASWFYGRVDKNNLWEVLPRIYNKPSLREKDVSAWRIFCKEHKIAFTDLIECIKDADEKESDDVELLAGYSDKAISKGFKSFDFVDVAKILEDNTSIVYVYLTRGIGESFWKKRWKLIENYADNRKNLRIRTLLTPSGYAYYQQGKHNRKFPNDFLNLPDFILRKWKEEWHF